MINRLRVYFEQQERYMERFVTQQSRHIFLNHAFGALEFVIQNTPDEDVQTDLVRLWEEEWRPRLEAKVYGV